VTLARCGLLVADSARTRAYVALLAERRLAPAVALLLERRPEAADPAAGGGVPYFDILTPPEEHLTDLGVPVVRVPTSDVNAPEAIDAVRASGMELLVWSGPAGAILRRPVLSAGARFLHMHPGAVPRFRGSTTVYYSLLIEGRCTVSAILLEPGIDAGPVVASRSFDPPEDRRTIDRGYDPYIRASVLADVLTDLAAGRPLRPTPQTGAPRTYYLIHPVLRHIAILAGRTTEVSA
jgi:methionyl-tRNA formyltransferase